jgi:SAM-dependent methyltransferase
MTTTAQLHQYSTLFYRYQREGSLRSARRTLPAINGPLGVRSVLDVGCGAGAWLAAHGELGVTDVMGVDGDYVDRTLLMVDAAKFQPQDITRRFDLGRRFDLVECLEVAEHVPTALSDVLVENIVRHGDQVLFSAGVPGQGGEDHINEQPMEFWRDRFARHGYQLFDFVRPKIVDDPQIEPWYRFNTMFFAHARVADRLPQAVRETRVPDGAPIADLAPLPFRLRKSVLRRLPVPAVTALARWKHRRTVQALARKG